MKILALESSATACSVALCEDDRLIAQSQQNNGLTHSRTLLPMCDAMLENCSVSLDEIDVIAVAAGPGSFTGVRIGIATAKGLAWSLDKDCAACSTLESMAWPLTYMEDALIVCAMDARRNQVYNAVFQIQNGLPKRIVPDRAIALDALCNEMKDVEKVKILVGDGAILCYNAMKKAGIAAELAPPILRMQSAYGVALSARKMAEEGELVKAEHVLPAYHRLSQAERERLEKTKEGVKE